MVFWQSNNDAHFAQVKRLRSRAQEIRFLSLGGLSLSATVSVMAGGIYSAAQYAMESGQVHSWPWDEAC